LHEMDGADVHSGKLALRLRFPALTSCPKNPRANARAKLRRRLIWLQMALHNTEIAIDDVFEAPGRTNKRVELEKIKTAIEDFRRTTGLTGDGLDDIPPIPDGSLESFLAPAEANLSAYTANTATFIADLQLSAEDDDDPEKATGAA
jgi:hypothetical protein